MRVKYDNNMEVLCQLRDKTAMRKPYFRNRIVTYIAHILLTADSPQTASPPNTNEYSRSIYL